MKLAILLTGQIRDEGKFREIILQLWKVRAIVQSITFSSWFREVQHARKLFVESAPGLLVNFADCGGSIPIHGRLNRDAGSLLAQFEQLCIGAEYIPDCDGVYTLRIRADMDKPDILGALIRILANHDTPATNSRSFIIGAGTQCFFFFEDRIMLLSPDHFSNIRALKLSKFTKYSTYNIFPEYVFYATACGATETFLRYDARYRERHVPQGKVYTPYDFAYHGAHFPELMCEYKEKFKSNFVFFDDAFADNEEYKSIMSVIPRFHTWYNEREYFEELDRLRSVYECEFAACDLNKSKNLSREQVFSEAELLAEVFILYQEGKYQDIVYLIESLDTLYLFSDQIRELFGCSLYIIGRFDQADQVLQDLYNRGHIGFELMFYLLLLKARFGDHGVFSRIAEHFMSAYGDNDRAKQHVASLSASFENQSGAAAAV